MVKGASVDDGPRADHRRLPRDSVDRLIADWEGVRSDLDFSPVAVISRLGRLRAHLDREVESLFSRNGITAPGFAVLVTLARLQAPGGVSQRLLMEELGLTSGTVSVRIDRLVADGLVARRPGDEDRRNTRITLTDAGRDLFERIVPAHLDNERRLLAALSEPERAMLAGLLRTLLVEFEGSAPAPGTPPPLGLALAPAHVTIAMRTAVGLPPIAGLLVRAVEEGGAGAAAGLRVGDVLSGAGGQPLTSIAALYAALDDGARGGTLELVVRRGVRELALEVPVGAAPGGGRTAAPAGAGRNARGEHTV